jgi:hypothetical protein
LRPFLGLTPSDSGFAPSRRPCLTKKDDEK